MGAAGFLAVVLAAGGVGAQTPMPTGQAAPLPVRLVEGTCESPGGVGVELSDGTAPGPMPEVGSVVHVSVTEVPEPIEDVAASGVILVGGSDAESAVACGQPGAVADDGSSVGILAAQHDSAHAGAILLRGTDEGTRVEVVVVSPVAPVSPSPSPGAASPPPDAAAPGSPAPSGAGLSPVRSALPGTSGAPPFSPLPGG